MVPLLLSYMFWNLYVREKKFSIAKHKIFPFQVFDFLIFQTNCHPTTVSESESVSESELFFGFGFGSSQNIRIISDSDPQHWLNERSTNAAEENLPRDYRYFFLSTRIPFI
jgi:hypothetical protein